MYQQQHAATKKANILIACCHSMDASNINIDSLPDTQKYVSVHKATIGPPTPNLVGYSNAASSTRKHS